MSKTSELTLPPPPRGKRAELKAQWRRMAKMLIDQGIDPNSRIDLLESYIDVICIDSDLSFEWEKAFLRDKISLSRRHSALLAEKLRLRKLLLTPEIKSQSKALARQGK